MAKRIKSYDSATRIDEEMRSRIHALTAGVKPTNAMVKASIAPLIVKLDRAAALRTTVEDDADRNRSLIYPPENQLEKPDADTLQALKKYRHASFKRAENLKVAPVQQQAFAPQIRSGSIWVGLSAPYTNRWTSGANAVANHLVGTWSTQTSGVNQSLAGICVFFTPVPGRFNIRFAPYMPVSFSYYLAAFQLHFPPSPVLSRASSSGFIGTYVSAWDGQQWVEMADVREQLWQRRVSINDEVRDSADSNLWTPQANFPAVGAPLTFALWAWGGITSFERDGTFGFAHSVATVAASVPFVIIEQMI